MKTLKEFAAAACILAIVVSCKKENPAPDPELIEESIEYEEPDVIQGSVAFLGSAASGFIGESIASLCPSISSAADEADILVVKSSELEANREAVRKAYEAYKPVVELEPSNASHSSFWTSIGATPCLDPEAATNDLIILCMHGNSCYQLQNPFLDGLFTPSGDNDTEDKTATESDESDEMVNYNAIPVPIEENSTFLRTKLCRFASWLNEATENEDVVEGTIPSFDSELAKRLNDLKYTKHFTKTLNVGADNFRICKVLWSDPDKVTRHSTIDLDVYVTPVYAYELNGADKRGDYYFVTAKMVSHNKPLYGLYREWHGAVVTHSHIFYSKNLKMDMTLLDSNERTLSTSNLSFEETPKPTTTATSTSYTTGLNKSLNFSGQAGVTGGKPTATITVGGNFTWSNSQTRTVKDMSIEMSTTPSERTVSYHYLTNNDKEEDKTEDAVPAIGRTDQLCDGAWCWHVNNTNDGDTKQYFKLKILLEPIYGYMWRHATWTCEGNRSTTCLLKNDMRTIIFDCPVPDRRKMGVIEIKSTNREYMYGLKILDSKGNVIAKDDGAYERNQTQRYQVPVGTFNIEYEIRNGDTGQSLGKYRISDVVINTAQTTYKSTIDGKKI